jgi:hypothetical protein
MQAFIETKLLANKDTQNPKESRLRIHDRRLPGFTLRVQPSGVRSYQARPGRRREAQINTA